VDSWQVVILVAGAALHSVDAVTVGTAPDIHDVWMGVVSLAREVSL